MDNRPPQRPFQESIDAALLARLLLPLTAPGVVSLATVQRIFGMVDHFSKRLSLMGDLSRRRGQGSLRIKQVPLVYCRWVTLDSTAPVAAATTPRASGAPDLAPVRGRRTGTLAEGATPMERQAQTGARRASAPAATSGTESPRWLSDPGGPHPLVAPPVTARHPDEAPDGTAGEGRSPVVSPATPVQATLPVAAAGIEPIRPFVDTLPHGGGSVSGDATVSLMPPAHAASEEGMSAMRAGTPDRPASAAALQAAPPDRDSPLPHLVGAANRDAAGSSGATGEAPPVRRTEAPLPATSTVSATVAADAQGSPPDRRVPVSGEPPVRARPPRAANPEGDRPLLAGALPGVRPVRGKAPGDAIWGGAGRARGAAGSRDVAGSAALHPLVLLVYPERRGAPVVRPDGDSPPAPASPPDPPKVAPRAAPPPAPPPDLPHVRTAAAGPGAAGSAPDLPGSQRTAPPQTRAVASPASAPESDAAPRGARGPLAPTEIEIDNLVERVERDLLRRIAAERDRRGGFG